MRDATSMSSMRENEVRIVDILVEIMKARGLAVPTLAPDTNLEELGLESLDFAEAVIRLEEITGKDPFATGAEYNIKTLSDLANLYDERVG
jgi:acyl carrier protein